MDIEVGWFESELPNHFRAVKVLSIPESWIETNEAGRGRFVGCLVLGGAS